MAGRSRWLIGLIVPVVAACGDQAAAPPTIGAMTSTTASPSTVALAAPMPSQGIAVSDADGLTLLTTGGSELARLNGLEVVPSDVPGPVVVHNTNDETFILASGTAALTRWSSPLALPLAHGAALARMPTRVLRGDTALWEPKQNASTFVSQDRDVVSVAGESYDLKTQSSFALPDGCGVLSRRTGQVFLSCADPQRVTGSLAVLDSEGKRHDIAPLIGATPRHRPPGDPIGSYRAATVSPDGKSLLVQFSGQCEFPVAVFVPVDGGEPQPAGGQIAESTALGWTDEGNALVRFSEGLCGSGVPTPGLYSLEPGGEPHLIKALGREARVAMWSPIP